ncbi:MAG: alcohol dehydrogenase catalytic domain-containing protein [Actinophytocola sp.]|uniref:alcohol dehydrogenase catalytic domain-containing protein n=1 Tax=Actinophytocola sp. TaxID=1872138 RepID=UPI00132575F5|nr:alcohol dehydrogenase catalytic domain-containing protein [Actinophytocola sp.]MPZ81982.1 alcohol dehydrogenase catalytic domain-containing protein [Actinophytocola sp.]
MKAWEVHDGALGFHDVADPTARAGETVVRVSHAGLCGSDTAKLLHPDKFDLPRPWRPGHEIVGMVPSGEIVAVDPLVPCEHCDVCGRGEIHLCGSLHRIGWDLPGGFAERVVVPVGNVHPLPTGLVPHHAVLADPAAVAIHGLRCNPVGPPARLAVIGAGAVGLLSALYAESQGWAVTLVHRRSPSVPVVETVPVTFASSTDVEAGTFDVVVDAATGADTSPLALALRLVRDGGTVVVQNAYHPDVALPVPLRGLFRRSVRLVGTFSFCRRERPGDLELALELLRSRRKAFSTIIRMVGGLVDLGREIDSAEKHIRQVVSV